jgi:CRISPR system Cascade subunit CasA
MNLLEERWIPIRRASGMREHIAPHEITDRIATDPVLALAAPRPDFNGALMQFLIGLVQTAWVRADRYWDLDDMLWSPPTPQTLAALFAPLREAFELDGDGPRFMQEFSMRPTGKANELRDVRALLIDAPGDATLLENRDHFVKRGAVRAMCVHCSAIGLFTLQIHAPNGGRGHVPSLRKGGEITTLIAFTDGNTGPRAALWRDVACNMLDTPTFKSMCDAGKVDPVHTFPWLAALDSLQRAGGQTWPRDVHPSHQFWPMPRRIRLDFDDVQAGACDVCGDATSPLITRYFTWPSGLNYNGESKEEKFQRKESGASSKQKRSAFPNWQHPLSPYLKQAAKTVPASLDDGGPTYRHWLGWAVGSRRGGQEVLPAAAVKAFHSARVLPGQVRLWAFGYDMDNMKARCWYETTFPLFDLPLGGAASAEAAELVVAVIDPLVTGAESVAQSLRFAVRDAWFSNGESRGDLGFVDASFWNQTERDFFSHVEQAIALCRTDGRDAIDKSESLRRDWLHTLRRAALRLFDEVAASGRVDAGNPGKLAAARRTLRGKLHGDDLLVALRLQPAEATAASSRSRRAGGRATASAQEAR